MALFLRVENASENVAARGRGTLSPIYVKRGKEKKRQLLPIRSSHISCIPGKKRKRLKSFKEEGRDDSIRRGERKKGRGGGNELALLRE